MACAGIEVHRLELDLGPGRLAGLSATLSPDELARAARFRFARDAERFVAGRGLLRAELAMRLDRAPETLRFGYGPAGKPFLSDHRELRFNLSGAGGLGLLAVADGIELGVDLELAESALSVVEIAEHFFSAAENEALRRTPLPDRPLACLRCWTRKEAYVKALGQGLQVSLDKFAVSLGTDEPAALSWCARPGEIGRWSLVDLSHATAGIVAALCHDGGADVDVALAEIC